MGFSSKLDNTIMCFNAPKTYQSGWYSSREVTLDSTLLLLTNITINNPQTFDLVGIADYENASGEQVVTVKLDNATSPYYIGFNRKTGIQAGTNGPADKVLVSTQAEDGQSWLLAELDTRQVHDIADYFGPGRDARIEVLGYTTDEPRVAQVAIYPWSSCSKYEYEFALNFETTGYASVISWGLQNADEEVVLFGSDYHDDNTYATIYCIAAGDYTLDMLDAHPIVGGYTITMDGRVVATNDGTTALKSHTFEVGCADSQLSLFELDLTINNTTSWDVTDASGQVVTLGTGYTDASTNYARFCLPNGAYTFSISDEEDNNNGTYDSDSSFTAYNQKELIGTGAGDLETYGFIVARPIVVVPPTFCIDDISLAGQIGSATYDSLPIKIISQDTTSVTIEVSNTWGETVLSNMFTRYDETSLTNTCHEVTHVAKTDIPSQYTIACMSRAKVAHVDIFVTDDTFSTTDLDNNATVPQCCHPEADVLVAPTVQYIFMLQCISQCPTEGIQRRFLRGS